MKIIEEKIKANSSGYVKMILDNEDDLFYFYQLVSSGDGLSMKIFRKIFKDHDRET